METSLRVVTRELDGWVLAWLEAKTGKSQSERTERAYRQTMQHFRTHLHSLGLDLDSDPAKVAVLAEVWAKRSHAFDAPPEATVSAATMNLRLAILSSFYRYWQQKHKEREIPNPLARVERGRVEEYASATPLEPDQLARIKEINRTTSAGLRNYALLQVALKTGRRASELTALCNETVRNRRVIQDDGVCITLYFKRCKGNKPMVDRLSPAVSAAVRAWITHQFGSLDQMPAGAPLWPVLAPHNRGGGLSVDALAYLCKKHLGTSRVHSTRHTFARMMEETGAKVSEIAARLGHANPTITGRYLVKLRKAENPYAEELDRLMGI